MLEKLWGRLRNGRAGDALDDLKIFLQGPGITVPVPGNAVVGLDRWRQRTEGHSGMGQVFDLLPRQCDAQAFGHEAEGNLAVSRALATAEPVDA